MPRYLSLLSLVSLLIPTACGKSDDELPLSGTVTVCTDISPDDGTVHLVSGVVVAIDDGASGCTRSLSVQDGAGAVHVVGWTVEDDDGVDHTPDLDLQEGAEVELSVRSVLVWGDVQGLMVVEGSSLVVAADEGTWGGALTPDLTGFAVEHGALLATDEQQCQTLDYGEVVFVADDTVSGEPLAERAITVAGEALQAMGVASIQRGPGSSCDISDTTDDLSWVVWR
jgi:hypothetical protein